MNKKLTAVLFVASALAAPALTYAQSTTGLTRAQVYADLVRLEKAGYNPSNGDDSKYPADIQAAEAKVAAEESAQTAPEQTSASVPVHR
jgi:hypothetical protein